MAVEASSNVRLVGFDAGPAVSSSGENLVAFVVRLLRSGDTNPVEMPPFVVEADGAERMIALLQSALEEVHRMNASRPIQ